MESEEQLEAAIATCGSVLSARDVEMVDVRLLGSGNGKILRVTLDRETPGLGIDEVTDISEEISRALDVDDPIVGSYTLEVETAGLERAISKPEHFLRFEGKSVKIKVNQPIEGTRVFKGKIASASEEAAVIQLDAGVVEIPYTSIKNAKLVADWDAELKQSVRTGED